METPLERLHHQHEIQSKVRGRTKFLQWQKLHCKGKSPSERSGAGSALIGRLFFVFGGFHGQEALDDFWVLNLDTLQWTQLNSTFGPCARTSHSVVADPRLGYIYVCCGSGSIFGHSNLADLWRYDIFSRQWLEIPLQGDTLLPRYGQSVVFHQQKLYIFGGTFGREFTSDFFEIDLQTRQCKRMPERGEIPCPRYKHACELLAPHFMILHGGATHLTYKLNDTFVCDLRTGRWRELMCRGDLPGGQFAHSLSTHPGQGAGKCWIFGGCDRISCSSDLYCLEVDSAKWTLLKSCGDMPSGRYFHSSVFDAKQGRLLIFSGKGSVTSPLRFNDLYQIFPDDLEGFCRPQSSLQTDILSMLFSQDMVDIEIVCKDGKSIKAHRLMLQARCESFHGENEIILLPFPLHTVTQFLYYLYSDKLPEIPANQLFDLLECSKVCRMDRLTFLCERLCTQTLVSGFEIEFCCDRDFLVSRLLGNIPKTNLVQDFINLRNESIPFDYSILLDDGSVVHTHQFMLASRCSFFRSESLRNWMSEANSPTCIFAGVPFAVFQFLLQFIYTDSIPLLPLEQLIPIVAQILRQDLPNYFGFSSEYLVYRCIQIITNVPQPSKGPLYFLESLRNRLPV